MRTETAKRILAETPHKVKEKTDGVVYIHGKEYWELIFPNNDIKKTVKDMLNHYKSKLAEATKHKLDRRDRTEYVIKLEAKVEVLKELEKKI